MAWMLSRWAGLMFQIRDVALLEVGPSWACLLAGQDDRLCRRIVSVGPALEQCDVSGNFPERFAELALNKSVSLGGQAKRREPYSADDQLRNS